MAANQTASAALALPDLPYPDTNASAINALRKQLSTGGLNRRLHASTRLWLCDECDATAAAGAANLAAERPLAARSCDDAINRRSGNRGQITPAKVPFLAHEAAYFTPSVFCERGADLARN